MPDPRPVESSRIHLVTCAGVAHDGALLDHFIRHYRDLGVPTANMHVILNAERVDEPALAQAIDVLAGHAIEPVETWIATYTSDAMWQRRRDVQRVHVPADAWMLSADVDEFHEYPAELPSFLGLCEQRGINCVDGVFIDRLAPDGALVPVEPDRPPAAIFPEQRVLQGSIFSFGDHHHAYGSVKMMAVAGRLLPDRGGHGLIEGESDLKYLYGRHVASLRRIADPRFRARIPTRVHHYKWIESLAPSLAGRLGATGVSPAGQEYGQQIIDHLRANDGHIDLARATRVQAVSGSSAMTAVERLRRREKWRRRIAKRVRKLRRRLGMGAG